MARELTKEQMQSKTCLLQKFALLLQVCVLVGTPKPCVLIQSMIKRDFIIETFLKNK